MASDTIRRIQQALKDKGFDPGAVDGIWGRNTIGAVKRFQAQHGLDADGIVGPQTTAALFPTASPVPPGAGPWMPWFEEARRREGFGDVTTPRFGAVMVFWRESLASGKGHVGFYAGEDETYQVLGGKSRSEVMFGTRSEEKS